MPEVYQLCTRIVDAEGYVNVNRVRYSAPYRLIGRALEVRETLERVVLYDGPRRVASHARVHGPLDTRVTDPAHRPPRGQGLSRHRPPAPEQIEILQIEPRLASYLNAFKQHVGERRAPLRRLLSMLRDYPRAAVPRRHRRCRTLSALRSGSAREDGTAPDRRRLLPARSGARR